MWNTVEKAVFANISATPASFNLRGGTYGIEVSATFGGGSVTLQRLSGDGSTYVTVLAAFTTAGYASVNLPSGTYRFLIATATAVFIDLYGIVTTQ